MGKKKSRATQVSKGERNNVNKDVSKALRRDYLQNDLARLNNQIDAFKRGKNVMVTIPNPNTNETNKRFLRVNAKDVWKFNNKFIMKHNTSVHIPCHSHVSNWQIKYSIEGGSNTKIINTDILFKYYYPEHKFYKTI